MEETRGSKSDYLKERNGGKPHENLDCSTPLFLELVELSNFGIAKIITQII
jgi:hypothetical protein